MPKMIGFRLLNVNVSMCANMYIITRYARNIYIFIIPHYRSVFKIYIYLDSSSSSLVYIYKYLENNNKYIKYN